MTPKEAAEQMWILLELKQRIAYYGYDKLNLKYLGPLRDEIDRKEEELKKVK